MDEMNYNLVMMAVRDLKDSNEKLQHAVGKQGDAIEKLAQALTQSFQDAASNRATQAQIIERVKKLEDEVAKLKPAS